MRLDSSAPKDGLRPPAPADMDPERDPDLESDLRSLGVPLEEPALEALREARWEERWHTQDERHTRNKCLKRTREEATDSRRLRT